jgi:uncharacterized protein
MQETRLAPEGGPTPDATLTGREHPPRGRRHGPTADPWIEPLPLDECLDLLRRTDVGRISVVIDRFPVILPVNHRLAEGAAGPVVYVRTRLGTSIDRGSPRVAFQIDGFDVHKRQGWSVLVRGTLRHVRDEQVRDVVLESWLADRDTWVVVVPAEITGRRLHASPTEWPFHPHAYI